MVMPTRPFPASELEAGPLTEHLNCNLQTRPTPSSDNVLGSFAKIATPRSIFEASSAVPPILSGAYALQP